MWHTIFSFWEMQEVKWKWTLPNFAARGDVPATLFSFFEESCFFKKLFFVTSVSSKKVHTMPSILKWTYFIAKLEYKNLLTVIFCTFWKFVFSVLLRCTKVLRRRKANKQHPRQPKSKQCVEKSYQEVDGPHSPCVLTNPDQLSLLLIRPAKQRIILCWLIWVHLHTSVSPKKSRN